MKNSRAEFTNNHLTPNMSVKYHDSDVTYDMSRFLRITCVSCAPFIAVREPDCL